ncbi:hypothetical protein GPECTOR_9g443 [Gonium pectorale]|uniref:Uncharacterized protein n=1 Tax=Gonium pectorale TaxID=33097 RepID=A0A150GRD7_GONPE|nr:hypothetical protein GPECTOR_9g443 [Gonium pectorale]|eukprot:KXZ52399.1 hypothetical protein GPECTOR_9g443 [Gonium pectorale]
MKANVVLPPSKGLPQEGDQVAVQARGVVLFMHGFAQGPTAYARMLTQLAATDVVVVAPCPPFGTTPEVQQKYMVDAALFWRNAIAANQLPGLTLQGATSRRVGLMGHSVGGGLAAFVADAAARNGQAFESAHVLAPQTTQVVDDYKYDVARGGSLLSGVATDWGVQYGLIDLLSLAPSVNKFRSWLADKDRLRTSVKYELGTHVGFEDQLVVGRESFTTDALPWILAVLWGALSFWLPWVGLRALSKVRGDTNVRAATSPEEQKKLKGVEGSIPANEGFGVPDDVELPDERIMLLGYVALAATVTAVEAAIPGFSWDSLGAVLLSVLKGVFLLLALGSWPAIAVYPYEAIKQRPEARRQVVRYFQNF